VATSEMNDPEVGVYPDSGNVMARQQAPGTPATGLRAIVRLEDGVDTVPARPAGHGRPLDLEQGSEGRDDAIRFPVEAPGR
jgi:hypothetical protein